MSNAFSRFQLLKDAGDWAGKQMRGLSVALRWSRQGSAPAARRYALGEKRR